MRTLVAVTAMSLWAAGSAFAQCDTDTEVAYKGFCYYLDGSGGVCDPGYSLAPQSVLADIAPQFVGKAYKHTVSDNCCVYNSEPDEDWGFDTSCNVAGHFSVGDPILGGAGCTDVMLLSPRQLTLCAGLAPVAAGSAPAASTVGLMTLVVGLVLVAVRGVGPRQESRAR